MGSVVSSVPAANHSILWFSSMGQAADPHHHAGLPPCPPLAPHLDSRQSFDRFEALRPSPSRHTVSVRLMQGCCLLLSLAVSLITTVRIESCAPKPLGGRPLFAFGICLGRVDADRSAWLPANLIQAHRDQLGAHTPGKSPNDRSKVEIFGYMPPRPSASPSPAGAPREYFQHRQSAIRGPTRVTPHVARVCPGVESSGAGDDLPFS